MEIKIGELRQLYYISPAKVYEAMKPGKWITADDESLASALRILTICKITYQLHTSGTEPERVHKILVSE